MGELSESDKVVAVETGAERRSRRVIKAETAAAVKPEPETIRNACVTCKWIEGDAQTGTSKLVCMHDDAAEDVKNYVNGSWTIKHPLCEVARSPTGACQPEGRLYQERK